MLRWAWRSIHAHPGFSRCPLVRYSFYLWERRTSKINIMWLFCASVTATFMMNIVTKIIGVQAICTRYHSCYLHKYAHTNKNALSKNYHRLIQHGFGCPNAASLYYQKITLAGLQEEIIWSIVKPNYICLSSLNDSFMMNTISIKDYHGTSFSFNRYQAIHYVGWDIASLFK